jgi:hypothetical protein
MKNCPALPVRESPMKLSNIIRKSKKMQKSEEKDFRSNQIKLSFKLLLTFLKLLKYFRNKKHKNYWA